MKPNSWSFCVYMLLHSYASVTIKLLRRLAFCRIFSLLELLNGTMRSFNQNVEIVLIFFKKIYQCGPSCQQKKTMIMSVNAEKVFDRAQYLSMIKLLTKLHKRIIPTSCSISTKKTFYRLYHSGRRLNTTRNIAEISAT